MRLTIDNLHKTFGDAGDRFAGLKRINFTLEHKERLCLLGPSGCGKTTLLRTIAGLEAPYSGRIVCDGRDITRLPAHKRRFVLMFQDFALFPHRNVYENIAFGLRMQNLPRKQIAARARTMIDWIGLNGMENRDITALSGGEKQRVALARSLAPEPLLLMLDEPMTSLDRGLREKLIPELKVRLRQARTSVIIVTHDQQEAFALADRVAVMQDGELVQIDTSEQVFNYPASTYVARFLGFENIFPAEVTQTGEIRSPVGRFAGISEKRKTTGWIVIRPDAACLSSKPTETPGLHSIIVGTVRSRIFQGRSYRLETLTPNNQRLIFELPCDPPPPVQGMPVRLLINPSSIRFLGI